MNMIPFSDIPRLKEVAAHIVHKCLWVNHGEIVSITGGIHTYWLLSQICTEVRKAGGHPLLNVLDDQAVVDRVNKIPEEYLGEKPPAIKELEKAIDVRLVISPAYNPTIEIQKDSQRVALINKKISQDNTHRPRTLVMEWPTPAKAKYYGLEFTEFSELFWRAFWVDPQQLLEQANNLKEKLQGAEKVIITFCDGSKLNLKIGERPVLIDTGCFTEELIKRGDLTKNLPCGEVYCSPIEDSINGNVFFQKVFYRGKWIKNLRLHFEKGTIQDFSAEEGRDVFAGVLEQHTGDKDRFAELGIGLNPNVPYTMGNTLLDEKVCGSIHLAIGRNTMYGGINKSSLHWDLVAMHPTIVVDDKEVMVEGKVL